jgi:hypothetical protein
MTRRRFVWSPDDDRLVEVTPDYEQPHRDARDNFTSDAIYDGLQATDGADISTRKKHREYMKKNGLTTVDDFEGVWAKSRKERDDYYTGKRGSVTKDDIARAIHQLQEGSRKRR